MSSSPISIDVVGNDIGRIEQSLAVLHEGLGQGYIAHERFLQYAAPRARRPFRTALAATDTATGSVIGVLTIEIVGARALRESFLNSYALVRNTDAIRLLRPQTTGFIKSIAVSPASRGRGIAIDLLQHGMQALADHGAQRYYSLAWTSKQQGCALCGALVALGFRSVRHIERFWYHDSMLHDYLCPSCGHPCECSVQVMVR